MPITTPTPTRASEPATPGTRPGAAMTAAWRARRPRRGSILAAVLALVLLAGAIGWMGTRSYTDDDASRATEASGSTGHKASDRAGAGAGDAVMSESAADSSAGHASAGSAAEPTATTAAPDGAGGNGGAVRPKVVKTGSIDLVVKQRSFAEAERQLRSIADGAGGYIAASSTSSQRSRPSGSLTLRVPADAYDEVVTRVGRIGTVTAAQSKSQDVTGEYTDLQSRLRAATEEREQILLVLGEAQGVPEILQVRDHLARLQAEIEEMQGRMKVLDDQTSLSTLTVSLRERGATASTVPVEPEERSGLAKAWDDAVDRFSGGIEAVVAGSGTVAFLLLLALVVWLVGRPVWRRVRPAEVPAGDGPA